MEHPWGALEIPGSWVSRGLRGRKKATSAEVTAPVPPWHSPRTPGLYQRFALSSVSCYPAGDGDKRALEKSGSVEGLVSCLAGPLRGENIQGFTESAGVPHCLCVDICFPLSSPTAPLAGYPRVPRAAFGAAGAEGHFWNASRGGWDQQALPREQLALEKRGIQGHSCFLGSTECLDMGFI